MEKITDNNLIKEVEKLGLHIGICGVDINEYVEQCFEFEIKKQSRAWGTGIRFLLPSYYSKADIKRNVMRKAIHFKNGLLKRR